MRRISVVRTGAVPTRDALRLRLVAGMGNVEVFTDASGEVRYRVRVEAEAGDPLSVALANQFLLMASGTPRGVTLMGEMPGGSDFARVQISYEIHVPRHYDLEVSTQAGDIVAQDIDGHVALSTGGGDIRAGNIGDLQPRRPDPDTTVEFAARLYTGGGHILAGDVGGALRAVTAGGTITAGNVFGDAILRTGGGTIQVGRVDGASQLFTGGGNIVAEYAAGGVVAETAGGRIEFGTAAGAIRAHSGGGGIRIARLAGPTQLASSDGGISLAGVEAPLRVSTATGSITASFSPFFSADSERAPGIRRPAEISELASGQGDIIVYLPREIAVTIDARIADGSDHRIVADPSLPLRVSYEDSAAGRIVHGTCAVNGGGQVIRLRTAAGNIALRYLDAKAERQMAEQQMQTIEQQLRARKALPPDVRRPDAGRQAGGWSGQSQPVDDSLTAASVVAAATTADGDGSKEGSALAATRFAMVTRMFDEWVWGGVRVDPDEQQRRLVRPILPVYPDVARQAGIEGDVTLRILIGRDGAVSGMDVLSGNPVLARAATHAVEQWRYEPALLGGWPVNVVTTVSVAFRLR